MAPALFAFAESPQQNNDGVVAAGATVNVYFFFFFSFLFFRSFFFSALYSRASEGHFSTLAIVYSVSNYLG